MSLLALFCDVDDFCQAFRPQCGQAMLGHGPVQRVRAPRLSQSEMMTILIHFHQSCYRTFKAYYTGYVQVHLNAEFPGLVSYNRFVELMPTALKPLATYLQQRQGNCTGSLRGCHRHGSAITNGFPVIGSLRVSQSVATTMGWFYGFKLHLVVNDRGEILACRLTPGNVDDRKPLPGMAKTWFGKLFGDKGYISQPLSDQLLAQGLELITPRRKNMKSLRCPWRTNWGCGNVPSSRPSTTN